MRVELEERRREREFHRAEKDGKEGADRVALGKQHLTALAALDRGEPAARDSDIDEEF